MTSEHTPDLEQMLADRLHDGRITDEDADTVRTFAEFLRHAGPPNGGARQRLLDAGREDLIDWAVGVSHE